MKKLVLLLFCAINFQNIALVAQEKNRFSGDVETIKKFDKIYAPTDDPIIFVGSSSIRRWNNAEQIFAKNNVINRGIGGALVNEIILYANELILDYNPRQVVIYVGENDFFSNKTTADIVFERLKKLFTVIREKKPNIPIVYISIKPSPGRESARDKVIETNKLVSTYIATQTNMKYVDVFTPMIKHIKSKKAELFVEDKVHLTAEGYKIWAKALRPHLLKK